MIKYGVFLARFQPLHNGHLYMIEKALKECDKVLIVMGSSNKEGMLRNPFGLDIRKYWIRNSIQSLSDFHRIEFCELPDWSTESDKSEIKQWGHYLYYNIVSRIQQKHFSIYYSDDVSIIQNWFDDEVSHYITIEHVERSNVFDGLSATKIREAILCGDKESIQYLKQYCPQIVYKDITFLRNKLLGINENPNEDFSMQ